MSVEFRTFVERDHDAVCDFLVTLNESDRRHVNWNWARFEWMYGHPEFDTGLVSSIGLWADEGSVVGAAIYDMYFGEAFCGVLPGYDTLYPEVLGYAYQALRDEAGLAIAICDGNETEARAARSAGFVPIAQTETIMTTGLDREFSSVLPEGLGFAELDQVEDARALQWLFWQGFDHGNDREEFERTESIAPRKRRRFNKSLSLAAIKSSGEPVSYCCLWFHPDTDYAYVEPVCTVPTWRGNGAAKAVVYEALDRARALGARQAYVISDQAFYERLGFVKAFTYTFHQKT